MVTFLIGLLLGATQNSCRVLFSELLPHGHEAKFFALYSITDKGSSWIVLKLIGTVVGSIDYSMEW